MAYTVLRGGRVLDIAAGTAEPADILIEATRSARSARPAAAAPPRAPRDRRQRAG